MGNVLAKAAVTSPTWFAVFTVNAYFKTEQLFITWQVHVRSFFSLCRWSSLQDVSFLPGAKAARFNWQWLIRVMINLNFLASYLESRTLEDSWIPSTDCMHASSAEGLVWRSLPSHYFAVMTISNTYYNRVCQGAAIDCIAMQLDNIALGCLVMQVRG